MDIIDDFPLQDGRAHIFIEWDPKALSQSQLVEAIEMGGAHILETITIREKPEGRLMLFKLDISDIREVVFALAKYPLNKIEGYNSKKIIHTGRRKE